MSTAAPAGSVPPPGASPAASVQADVRSSDAQRVSGPALTPVAARLLGMGLLVALCELHTVALVEPAAPGGGLLAGIGCALAALGLSACGRLADPWRPVAGAGVVLALGLVIGLAAGIPVADLRPAHLGATLHALGQALGALPNVHVPFVGSDEWVRRAVALSADGALGAATALVFWPASGRRPQALGMARRLLAGSLVVVVYAAAEVNLRGDAQAGRGIILFAGLAALLWLERVERAVAGPAALAVGLAGLAGLAAAPGLEHSPLVNISATRNLAIAGGEGFDWNQRYGPLSWPRDGRTVLEVRSPTPDYWKAVALERFDGSDWVQDSAPAPAAGADPGLPAAAVQDRSTRTVSVTLGALRTTELIGAGTTTRISGAPLPPVPGTSPGTFRVASGALGRGQSYAATVYTPHPDLAALGAATSTAYPAGLAGDLELSLPLGPGPPVAVRFPALGQGGAPVTVAGGAPAAAALARSPYARAWRLAGSLAARAHTPAELVSAAQAALGPGFRYSEGAPVRRYPLEAFLFSDRRGSCQHFSGAMALLLRMAGVPSRVAAGFTSGRYDARRGVWSATDVDAHAWVEAYFPQIGWVAFDPTPTAAPARGGHGGGAGPTAGRDRTRRSTPRPRPRLPVGPTPAAPAPRPAAASAGPGGGASSWALIIVFAALSAVGLAALAARRRLTRRWGGAPGAAGAQEVARALRARGLDGHGLTFDRLATRVADAPGAARYLRALAELRFGSGAPRLPLDPAGRRALRRALGRDADLRERLALLVALPPGGGPPRPQWHR